MKASRETLTTPRGIPFEVRQNPGKRDLLEARYPCFPRVGLTYASAPLITKNMGIHGHSAGLFLQLFVLIIHGTRSTRRVRRWLVYIAVKRSVRFGLSGIGNFVATAIATDINGGCKKSWSRSARRILPRQASRPSSTPIALRGAARNTWSYRPSTAWR